MNIQARRLRRMMMGSPVAQGCKRYLLEACPLSDVIVTCEDSEDGPELAAWDRDGAALADTLVAGHGAEDWDAAFRRLADAIWGTVEDPGPDEDGSDRWDDPYEVERAQDEAADRYERDMERRGR